MPYTLADLFRSPSYIRSLSVT